MTTSDQELLALQQSSTFSENIWIEDTATSRHYCNSNEGLFDMMLEHPKEPFRVKLAFSRTDEEVKLTWREAIH